MQSHSPTWLCFLPALTLSFCGVGVLAAVQATPVAKAAEPVAVFAFGGDALGAVIDAGGRMIGPGGFPGSIIAIGDTPDFADRLYAAGASLVLRASDRIGCTTATLPGTTS